MDTLKTVIISVAVALVTVLGVWGMNQTGTSLPSKLGALSGPDIPFNYLNWGGLREYRYSQAMAVASTTCAFQSPAATSTLAFAGANVSNSSTGATLQYEWGIAANQYSTTTSLGIGTIASAAKGTVLASTTNANTGDNVDQQTVIAPSTWVNLKVSSTTPTTQTGNCYASFLELPNV